ncbi:MAG: YajG family lipoprotein [Thermoanaerobaculia bacterium]
MRHALYLLLLFAATSAFARDATPKEIVVDLQFKPQEGVHSSSATLPPSVVSKPVELRIVDGRNLEDPLVIGRGTGGDDRTFPIRAREDIRKFIGATLKEVAQDWGVKVADGADRVLVITITRFDVDESNKALGSVYSSEVKLGFTLKDAGGKDLVEGVGVGSTHRYGRAHSEENMNEVLSDALKEAFANVLDDGPLQRAWSATK